MSTIEQKSEAIARVVLCMECAELDKIVESIKQGPPYCSEWMYNRWCIAFEAAKRAIQLYGYGGVGEISD